MINEKINARIYNSTNKRTSPSFKIKIKKIINFKMSLEKINNKNKSTVIKRSNIQWIKNRKIL